MTQTNLLKTTALAVAILTSLFAQGCASITQGRTQSIAVQTTYQGSDLPGSQCKLQNDKGSWNVVTPGQVEIQKSYQDLEIKCAAENGLTRQAKRESKSGAGMWGNIAAGGPIGAIVDRNTGAGFNYPESIIIPLFKKLSNQQQEKGK